MLEWQPPASLAVPVNMYYIVMSESQFGLPNITRTSATTSILIAGLEEYNNYTCELRAISIYGIQSQPLELEFETLEGGEFQSDIVTVKTIALHCPIIIHYSFNKFSTVTIWLCHLTISD